MPVGETTKANLIYDDNNGDGEWDPVHTGSESLGFAIGRSGTMTRYLEGSLNYNRLFAEKTSCRRIVTIQSENTY